MSEDVGVPDDAESPRTMGYGGPHPWSAVSFGVSSTARRPGKVTDTRHSVTDARGS